MAALNCSLIRWRWSTLRVRMRLRLHPWCVQVLDWALVCVCCSIRFGGAGAAKIVVSITNHQPRDHQTPREKVALLLTICKGGSSSSSSTYTGYRTCQSGSLRCARRCRLHLWVVDAEQWRSPKKRVKSVADHPSGLQSAPVLTISRLGFIWVRSGMVTRRSGQVTGS